MDEESRDLASALFAAASVRLELAHEATIEGQGALLDFDEIIRLVERIRGASHDAIVLAEAVAALARTLK
jgi:hypothetical protein